MTIAILAHDSRKELALQFCTAYSAIRQAGRCTADHLPRCLR